MPFLVALFFIFVFLSIIGGGDPTSGVVIVLHVVETILFVIALVVLWLLRVPIVRTFYFIFCPHPATAMVEAALSSERKVDGKALAEALGEVPPENKILREVRFAQGEALLKRMQEHSLATARAYEERARNEHERAALIRLQAAVALSAEEFARKRALYRRSESEGGE